MSDVPIVNSSADINRTVLCDQNELETTVLGLQDAIRLDRSFCITRGFEILNLKITESVDPVAKLPGYKDGGGATTIVIPGRFALREARQSPLTMSTPSQRRRPEPPTLLHQNSSHYILLPFPVREARSKIQNSKTRPNHNTTMRSAILHVGSANASSSIKSICTDHNPPPITLARH